MVCWLLENSINLRAIFTTGVPSAIKGTGPIQAGLTYYTLFEVAQQTTKDFPSLATADFQVSLLIYSDYTGRLNSSRGELLFISFFLSQDFGQLLASHFYEFHGNSFR